MGLGRLFQRNLEYQVTDTQTGGSELFTVITDGGPGMFADWGRGAYQGGMGIPAAWRAALLLSDLIGSVPWHAYRDRGGQQQMEVISPTPPLLTQPAAPDTRMTTFSSWALDLVWHGNAIGIIAARSREGWPTAVLPVRAECVQVRRVGQNDAGDMQLPVGAITYGIGNRWWSSDDVLHIKGPCAPGALRGLGVLENHLRGALGLAVELDRQAGSIGAAGIPTGVLKSTDPDLDQATATDLKTAWLRSQRDRTIAVLNDTTAFEPIAWNPTETQLIDARRFSLTEMALIFGLPSSFLGADQASRTYSNVEQEAINLIKFSLGGHLARFEQTLTQALPRGTCAKANLDSILRSDTKTRYEAHAIAIAGGFLTVDEVRALEDRPPLTPAQREALTPVTAVPAGQGSTVDQPAARTFDASPGNVKALHKYWVLGEGRARWTLHPQPLRALFDALQKYMPTAKAKWTALSWFEEGMGRSPVSADGDLPEIPVEGAAA